MSSASSVNETDPKQETEMQDHEPTEWHCYEHASQGGCECAGPARTLELADASAGAIVKERDCGGGSERLRNLEKHPVARQALDDAGRSLRKSRIAHDAIHLKEFEGTDFLQWFGRRADGCFHPIGPVLHFRPLAAVS